MLSWELRIAEGVKKLLDRQFTMIIINTIAIVWIFLKYLDLRA
jgi:hypothetical protein